MTRLSTIRNYVIVLLNCALFSPVALLAFDGQAHQQRPVAEIPAEPEARLDAAHDAVVKETSARCQCLSHAQGDCDAVTETVIIFDASSSMSEPCEPGGLRKLEIAQWALSDILDAVPTNHSVGVLFLEKTISILKPLGPLTGQEKSKLRRGVMEKRAIGSAKLKSAFETIRDMVEMQKGKPRLISVILLTDGMTCRPAEAQVALEELAKLNRVRFDVLCIGCNRTHHEEFMSLARTVNGRVDVVCSTKDLSRALAGLRRDYDDVWKCSQGLCERYRQELKDCCSEQYRLRTELKQKLEELGEAAQMECESLKLTLKLISNIEKSVADIDVRTDRIVDELASIAKRVLDCDEKLQRLEKIEVATNEESKAIAVGVNRILRKLEEWPSEAEEFRLLVKSQLNRHTEKIDADVQLILTRLNDWRQTPVHCDPESLADAIFARSQFWLFLLVLLLIAQLLLILACLLRPRRDAESQSSSSLKCPESTSLATQTIVPPGADSPHESKASEPCPPKSPAPPANPSKYLGSGKHAGTKDPKRGGPTDHNS